MKTFLLFLLICLPLIANALSKEDTELVQNLRKDYRTQLWKFLGDLKIFPQLKKIYDDFMACKTGADKASSDILSLLPTFYPSADKRNTHLSGLAAMLVMIDSIKEARECKPEDTELVQNLRKDYRTQLWKFLGDLKIFPQLRKIYDDFMACRTGADKASSDILALLPTFYPSADKRNTDLSGLAAMLVMIDSIKEARVCLKLKQFIWPSVKTAKPVLTRPPKI